VVHFVEGPAAQEFPGVAIFPEKWAIRGIPRLSNSRIHGMLHFASWAPRGFSATMEIRPSFAVERT
jgi:hypothetical protein